MYKNKFEVPLTIYNTEQIFQILKNSKYREVIQNVYVPPHPDDGGSGRVFKYPYDKAGYYRLLRLILKEVEVVMTFPQGIPEVIEKYARLGVKRFMVSNWNDAYTIIKQKYPGVIIERSIVGNSYNETIDYRFDGIVIPYKWLLDIEKIKEASKDIKLIALVNHNCRVSCSSLDIHPQRHITQIFDEKFDHSCPMGKTFFVPKPVVDELTKYVSTIKITDRLSPPEWYLDYLNYYAFDKPFEIGNNLIREEQQRTIDLFNSSNMKQMNCRFECQNCSKKCY